VVARRPALAALMAVAVLGGTAKGTAQPRLQTAKASPAATPTNRTDGFAGRPSESTGRHAHGDHNGSKQRPFSCRATPKRPPADAPIRWRTSRPIGLPWAGRLEGGVQLPSQGRDFFTWDHIRLRAPNRPGRRWGTAALVRTILRVARGFRRAHPNASRVGIDDLSRRPGGDFGDRYGKPGHSSHQTGLDVDVLYPRRDRLECAPRYARQIDPRLAQDLVDRFVAAGATNVFVGPKTRLTGPSGIVSVLPLYHGDHFHVRLPARSRGQ
jgi:murein endopeptidase